jgi:uncharacterized protein with PQ loop repeat
MSENYIEWLGYAASFFVAISFTFKKMTTLRIVSVFGCILFVIYGYFIDSVPVMITNSFITIMNIYFLLKKDKPIAINRD